MADDARGRGRAPRPRHPRGPVSRGVDGRIRLLRVLVLAFFVLIGGRAVALAASSNLDELARQQQTKVVELPAPRGAIVDRHGQELAVGAPQQTVYATPSLIDDPLAAAADLSKALNITSKKEQRALVKTLSDKTSSFAFIARKADPDLAKAALALGIPGVGAYMEEERSYPMKGSAAQVIGLAGMDNNGLSGIELEYDKELAGVAGSQVVVRDTSERLLRTLEQTDPVPGADVRLTLDAEIQYMAEDVLTRTLKSSGAKSAVAVVMNPESGEILAMVNAPVVKNHVFGVHPETEDNMVTNDLYEPGSIFKMVTISGALADGTVSSDDTFTLAPSIRVADRVINESHERGTVTYSLAEILQWSSNVGAVTIAQMMGKAGLYKWIEAFHFGQASGIGFPGESSGIVPSLDQWSDSSIGNIPMGQGIAVTPLQMATAVCAVANDGVMVAPKLVLQVGDRENQTEAPTRVIPARVAKQVRKMLTKAVDAGTGQKAKIAGYKVAGKTGTSEKPLPDGSGYSKYNYVASFAGMVPADDPKLVVLVAVDSPRSSIYGGDIAAPAVREIMSFALQHLEIAP